MKNKFKTFIKRTFLILAFIALMIGAIITAWETVRPNVVSRFETKEVVAAQAEPTDYELYVASKEVQDELKIMWKRHQMDELTKEITELETSKQ